MIVLLSDNCYERVEDHHMIKCAIAKWLDDNVDKFDVSFDASTSFVTYIPEQLLAFRGKPIDIISVKLDDDGDAIAVYDNMGNVMKSNNVEEDFKWVGEGV